MPVSWWDLKIKALPNLWIRTPAFPPEVRDLVAGLVSWRLASADARTIRSPTCPGCVTIGVNIHSVNDSCSLLASL